MKNEYNLLTSKENKKVMSKLFFNNKIYKLKVTPLNGYDVTDYIYSKNKNLIELKKYIGSGSDITTP